MTSPHKNNARFGLKKNKEMKSQKVPPIYQRSYERIVGRRSYRLFSDMRMMDYWTLYWNLLEGWGASNATCVKILNFRHFPRKSTLPLRFILQWYDFIHLARTFFLVNTALIIQIFFHAFFPNRGRHFPNRKWCQFMVKYHFCIIFHNHYKDPLNSERFCIKIMLVVPFCFYRCHLSKDITL